MKLTAVTDLLLAPVYVIHFVTHRCNLFCDFCCDGHNRRHRGELSTEEIRRFYANLSAAQVTITGGEPSLRDDLTEILSYALDANVHAVSLNTNGILPARLERTVAKALSTAKKPSLKVNLSIDGFRETHDRMRGKVGAFDNTVESIERLLSLQGSYPALSVRINTVVTGDNHHEVMRFRDFVRFRFPRLADHIFSLHRAGPGERVAPNLIATYQEVTGAQAARKLSTKHLLLKRFHNRMYEQIATIADARPTTFKCPAGGRFAEVTASGDVLGCEVLPKPEALLGRLQDYEYRLSDVLRSSEARAFRERIARDKCACTFECAHLTAAALELPKAIVPKALRLQASDNG